MVWGASGKGTYQGMSLSLGDGEEAGTEATPLCCFEHAFESTFLFQGRARFVQERPLNDSCHVLGDLLVISGSFLRLALITAPHAPFTCPGLQRGFDKLEILLEQNWSQKAAIVSGSIPALL